MAKPEEPGRRRAGSQKPLPTTKTYLDLTWLQTNFHPGTREGHCHSSWLTLTKGPHPHWLRSHRE